MRNSSTLALFSSEPFYETCGKRYFTRSKWDTLSLMSAPFRQVVLALPRNTARPITTELVTPPEQYKWLPLYTVGGSSGILQRLVKLWKTAVLYLHHYQEWDVIYVRLFFWDALIAGLLSIILRKEMYASLHGDIEEAVLINWQTRRYPEAFKRAVSKALGVLTRMICSRASVLFVSGPALAEKYAPTRKDVVLFLDSSFSEGDIFVRKDTCQSLPIRLLYVGELVPRKGISDLLKAVSILQSGGQDVRLRLVGTGEIKRYQVEASLLGLDDYVEFVGYVPYGPKLFQEYQRADIFVLVPLGAEGWSRVLIEASAHSLPIVTTNVGSLGRSVRDFNCGIVVSPGSAQEIANAITTIISDSDLRKQFISGSIQRALHHTRGKEASRVHEALARVYPDHVNSFV